MKKLTIGIIVTFVVSSNIFGQEKSIDRSNQQWIQYYNQTTLSQQWVLLLDGGYRWAEFSTSAQYIARLGFGYRLNNHLQAGAGFAHLGFYEAGEVARLEFRPYQEFLIRETYGKVRMAHRFRIEERYFYRLSERADRYSNSFNFRFRYLFSLNIPLFKLSGAHPDRKVMLSIGNEILVNAGKKVTHNVFDQNRLLIGPDIALRENFRLRFIYHGQFTSTGSPLTFRYHDIIWLGIIHRLDRAKKDHPL